MMWQNAQLTGMAVNAPKKFPDLKRYLVEGLREDKKAVKGVDENAIKIRLQAYNQRWEKEKNGRGRKTNG